MSWMEESDWDPHNSLVFNLLRSYRSPWDLGKYSPRKKSLPRNWSIKNELCLTLYCISGGEGCCPPCKYNHKVHLFQEHQVPMGSFLLSLQSHAGAHGGNSEYPFKYLHSKSLPHTNIGKGQVNMAGTGQVGVCRWEKTRLCQMKK